MVKEETTEESEIPRVIVDSVEIVNGFVSYEDYTLESKFDF